MDESSVACRPAARIGADQSIACCRELGDHLQDRGEDELAGLLARIADFHARHALQIARLNAGAAHAGPGRCVQPWFGADAAPPELREFVMRSMTPRMALEIALRAEEEVRDSFNAPPDGPEKSAAGQPGMLCELDSHIARLEEALAGMSRAFQPGEALPGDPLAPQEV